jgi:hypothetical protein
LHGVASGGGYHKIVQYTFGAKEMTPHKDALTPPKNYRKLNAENCTNCGYYFRSPVPTKNGYEYWICGRGDPKGWKDTGFFAQFYVCDGYVCDYHKREE